VSTKKTTAGKATAKRPSAAKKAGARASTARKRTAKTSTATKASAPKTTAAKKSGAKTTAAKKTAAKRTGARKTSARQTTAGTSPPRKSPATKGPGRTTAAATGAAQYTKPELRERLKARVLRGTKGGKAGQWSARKAQLLAHEYEAAGGGYKGGKSATQRHLQEWTHEDWTTSDGKRAQRGGATTRYLPKTAWSKLSASEKAATNRKKVEGSRRGKQHVANTTRATRARRAATTQR
jgi:hypothetical protein